MDNIYTALIVAGYPVALLLGYTFRGWIVAKYHREFTEAFNVKAKKWGDLIKNKTLEINKLEIYVDELKRKRSVHAEELKFLIEDAKPLIDAMDKLLVSGEYKRHQVYASMLKKHPDASKREVALAIELALDE